MDQLHSGGLQERGRKRPRLVGQGVFSEQLQKRDSGGDAASHLSKAKLHIFLCAC